MDKPSFTIAFDDRARLLRVAVAGFWSADTVRDYTVALNDAIARVRGRGLPLRLVIDAASMKAQSAEVGEMFLAAWRTILSQPADRAAIVAESALAAMQFRRLYASEQCHVVASTSEAEAWLADQPG